MSVRNARDHEQKKRRHRIEKLKERLNRLAGHPVLTGFSDDCPDEIREGFLQSVLAFEETEEVTIFDELVKCGVQMPSPERMDEAELRTRLWEVIRGMASLGAYLHSTDHLSDRELYERLWTHILREPTVLMPENPCFAAHIDIIGGFSEEDIQLYLRYYADEETRRRWAADWPDDSLPPREVPPYDRDRHLPQPGFET